MEYLYLPLGFTIGYLVRWYRDKKIADEMTEKIIEMQKVLKDALQRSANMNKPTAKTKNNQS